MTGDTGNGSGDGDGREGVDAGPNGRHGGGSVDGRPAALARRRILGGHRDTVVAVVDAAGSVADGFGSPPATTDRRAVTEPLERRLADRGLNPALLSLLTDAVDAAGYDLRADPVPAPPYLVVTGRGPVLRGTVAGGRLVVTLGVFVVGRDPGNGGPRYVRADPDPETVLDVEFRRDASG